MSPRVRLLICHQSQLFRESLMEALAGADGMDVAVVSLEDAAEGATFSGASPDLMIIDACLPDREAFRMVQAFNSTTGGPRTILLVPSGSPSMVESCLQAGANACVLDEDGFEDLRQAIAVVLSGRSYCSPQMARQLFTECQPGRRSTWSTHVAGSLLNGQVTQRELQILRLIAQRNMSNKQIARELRLSVFTVKNHVHNIIEKLSVEDRQSAARYALRQGLLSDTIG